MAKTLNLKKEEFLKFLQSLGKINDTSIFSVKEDRIEALSSSDDNSMCLLATLKGDFEEMILNIPSVGKLAKLIKLVPNDNISLMVNSNHLEYKEDGFKFKYHLYDDGILTRPKLSSEKIRSFVYPTEFGVTPEDFSALVKKISIIRSPKLYVYGEDGNVMWAFEDRTAHNGDSLTIKGGEVDNDFDEFITKTDNLSLITLCGDLMRFRIADFCGNVSVDFGNLSLEYIILSLQK